MFFEDVCLSCSVLFLSIALLRAFYFLFCFVRDTFFSLHFIVSSSVNVFVLWFLVLCFPCFQLSSLHMYPSFVVAPTTRLWAGAALSLPPSECILTSFV